MIKCVKSKIILDINNCSYILSNEEAKSIHKRLGKILKVKEYNNDCIMEFSYEFNNEVMIYEFKAT